MTDIVQTPTMTGALGHLRRTLATVMLLVAVGDFLCFHALPGAGMAVFGFCVIGAAYGVAPRRPPVGRCVIAFFIMIVAEIPWVMAPGVIAFCLAMLGMALAAACLNDRGALWRRSVAILFGIGWCIWRDVVRLCATFRLRDATGAGAILLMSWLLPVLGGAVFIALFANANPVIASVLSVFDPRVLLAQFSLARCFLWLLLACVVWPFLAPPAVAVARVRAVRPPAGGGWAMFFGIGALVRALPLFNLLFAIQTGLDAAYLWGGMRLPSGLTYADYAHRGAYPLIVAAVLAGGFAVLATRAAAGVLHVRWLVLLWTVQTLALVGACIFRLSLYVRAYSLTELRFAAFIWMLLVLAGLALICLRIVWRRSDRWLLRANLLAALAVLYVVSCLNVPWIVAAYDVDHCWEVTHEGAPLDVNYMVSLGPQAIPALDHYMVLTGGPKGADPFDSLNIHGNQLAFSAPSDWRGFSIWSWILELYLETHGYMRR